MKKNEEHLNLCEKTEKYEILNEEIKDGYKICKIKSYSSVITTCKIPIHTPEKLIELSEQICTAMISLAHPDIDLSKVTYMEIEL